MNKQEYYRLEKNASISARQASEECTRIAREAQKFYEGYTKGISDILKLVEKEKKNEMDSNN